MYTLFTSTTFVLFTLLGNTVIAAPSSKSSLVTRVSNAPYSQPTETLAAALACPDGFSFPNGKPTLLVPGTAEVANQSFGEGYYTQLKQDGYDPCYVNIDQVSLGDAQITAEYVAYNIAQLSQKANNSQIRIVAHSQGNMNTQWALLFWPSLRPLVKNFVSVAGGFKGTVEGQLICSGEQLAESGCTTSLLQQSWNSSFVQVLTKNANTDLVPLTSIYTLTDDIIQPEFPKSIATSVVGGKTANFAVQDLCPVHVADHFTMLVDPVAYAFAKDALDNDGYADFERVSKNNAGICFDLKPIGSSTSESAVTAAKNAFNDLVAIFGNGKPLSMVEPLLMPYAAAVA